MTNHTRIHCLRLAQSVTCLLAGMVLLSQSHAQELTGAEGVLRTATWPQAAGINLTAAYGHTLSSSLKSGATGKMSMDEAMVEADYRHRHARGFVDVSLGYTRQWNHFSGPNPFGNTDQIGIDLYAVSRVRGDFGVFFLGSGGFAAETGASLGNSVQGSIAFGPSYALNPSLTIFAGPFYRSRLERSDQIIGIAGIDWRINERWHLRTFNGAALTHDLSGDGHTKVDVSVEYQTEQFRLRDQSPMAGNQNNALSHRSLVFGIGLTHKLFERFQIGVHADVATLRRYRFRSDGASVSQFKARPGISLSVRGGMSF